MRNIFEHAVIKAAFTLILTMAILTGLALPAAYSYASGAIPETGGEEAVQPEEKEEIKPVTKRTKTSISGFKLKYKRSYRKNVVDRIKVSPAYGRTLELRRYDPYLKKWVTEKKIKTKNKEKASVKIKFTGTWRSYPESKWKVVAPKETKLIDGGKTKIVMKKAQTKKAKISVKKFHNAGHAIVFDAKTGKCLYVYKATANTPIASVRKMMTGVLLDEHKSPDDRITVRELGKNTITLGLKSGDIVRAKDLMHAMFLPSSNDAASATAAGVGGTHSTFIRMMNRKAKKLGMKRTRYTSPVGDGNGRSRTTCYDQALLGRYIMTSKTTSYLRSVLKKKRYSFTSLKYGKHYSMKRGNMLLGTRYKSLGIKTGYNAQAKWCFCNAWRYKGRLYISVVTKNPTRKKRWQSVKALTRFTKFAVDHGMKGVTVKE